MCKLRYVVVALVLGARLAPGAVATFDPPHVQPVTPGQDVSFNITVAVDSLAVFNWAEAVIGIEEDVALAFEYSDEWYAAWPPGNVSPPVYDVGVYVRDVYVGADGDTPIDRALALGTVTVGTTGLPDGTYTVMIDSSDDVSALGLDAVWEDLDGMGTFYIPEPASLLFLLCAVGLLRGPRRKGG